MRRLLPILGYLLLDAAMAQSGYFQGVTPRPPDVYPLDASLTVTRTAPEGGLPNVVPAQYTHVTTQPTSRTLEWANLTVLNNPSDYGANVASYSQAQKTGRGPTWAGPGSSGSGWPSSFRRRSGRAGRRSSPARPRS